MLAGDTLPTCSTRQLQRSLDVRCAKQILRHDVYLSPARPIREHRVLLVAGVTIPIVDSNLVGIVVAIFGAAERATGCEHTVVHPRRAFAVEHIDDNDWSRREVSLERAAELAKPCFVL